MKAKTKTMIAHSLAFVLGSLACAFACVIIYLAGGGDFSPGRDLQFLSLWVFLFSPGIGFVCVCLLGAALADNKFHDDEESK